MNNNLGAGWAEAHGDPADQDQQALFDSHENLRKTAYVREHLYDIAAREGKSRATGSKGI
jgi:hypothetical protein